MPVLASDNPLASTPSERAEGWRDLAARLDISPDLIKEPVKRTLSFVPKPIPIPAASSGHMRGHTNWLAIAASLGTLVFGTLFGLKSREVSTLEAELAEMAKPRVEAVQPLRSINTRGTASPPPVAVAPTRLGMILRIDLPAVDPEDPPQFLYRVEITTKGDQRPLQIFTDLPPDVGNVLRLRIARGSFPPGIYRLQLYGTTRTGETASGTYEFEIVDPSDLDSAAPP
jgi:hypothetical protein